MKRIAAAALVSAFVLLATAATCGWLIDARMEEVDRLLRQVSDAEGDPATLGIVVRFELIRRRQQLGEDRVESYELEARLQSLVSGTGLATAVAGSPRLAARLAQVAFRTSRELVRGERAPAPAPAGLSALEEAYLWERGRRYQRALEKYDRLLVGEAGLSRAVRERVHLHRAFCLAMIGDYAAARALCERLSEAPSLDDTASVARQMLRFFTGFEARRVEIAADGLAPVDLGRELYLAMDYRGAAGVLGAFVERRTGDPRSAEARYFLARSLEELGADADAEYRRVMMLDPDGTWAREANRRLVMIGKFYGGSQEAGEGATRRLSRMGDRAFVDAVEPYKDLVAPDPGAANVARDSFAARPADRGELFVQTTPSGAQISVNGLEMGVSPVFVTDVPFGRNVVRAVAGPHTGEVAISVEQSGTIPVIIALAAPIGAIRVETTLGGAEVFIDDARATEAELRALAPGKRVVLVRVVDRSGRVLYWEKEVDVKAGETFVVKVP